MGLFIQLGKNKKIKKFMAEITETNYNITGVRLIIELFSEPVSQHPGGTSIMEEWITVSRST